MRDITYRYLLPFGPRVPSDPVTKSLADFVQDIPYFLVFSLIPPLSVMNAAFEVGEDDAGMSGGCVWEPFSIDEAEYLELSRELQTRGLRYVVPPPWVKDKTDWNVWQFEFEVGVPADEFYRLLREDQIWSNLMKQAVEEGDERGKLKYHVKGVQAGMRLARFIDPYIRKYHKRKGLR
jgi:hypothetical protein